MKRNILFNLFPVLCLTFLMIYANAQNSNGYPDLIKKCEDLINNKMKSDQIIGVSAAIIVNLGKRIWLR
jgi:hypothetical protein